MKLTDHESDTTAALRLDPAPVPTPHRTSWLDRLARHLGSVPVDHMLIVPRDPVPPASACCATAECCNAA